MVVVHADLLGRGHGVVERTFDTAAKLVFGVPVRLIHTEMGMAAVVLHS